VTDPGRNVSAFVVGQDDLSRTTSVGTITSLVSDPDCSLGRMSTSKVDPLQRCRYDYCNSVGDATSGQPCHATDARSFDLHAAFRRRLKLDDDDDDRQLITSPGHSEFSDDYTSMNGSDTSTSALAAGLLDDRLSDRSLLSGDSCCLYDLDDDDCWSVSTLENVDGMEDQNVIYSSLFTVKVAEQTA